MKLNTLLSFLLVLAILFTACSDSKIDSDSVLNSVPSDVSMVTAINTEAILEKADFEKVKEMPFYKELVLETMRYNHTLGKILENPAQSGIDISKNIFVSHILDQNNPEDVFVAIVAEVKDEAALSALVTANPEYKITQQDGFQVAMKGSQSVSWNEEKVVLGMTNSYSDPMINIEKFFNTLPENSIAKDEDLKKAMSGNHDISSWMSSNALASSPSLKNALLMASIDPNAAKDNFIHGYLDFNNGAIEGLSEMYLQAALLEDINLLFKDKVTTDFSSLIPADADAVMTVSLDLEGVLQLLQKKGALMMANFGIKKYGLTVEDIAGTFGGDVLLYATPGKSQNPDATFATDIANKELLEKFLMFGTEFNFLKKLEDNRYEIISSPNISGNLSNPNAQLLVMEDKIIISGSSDIISKIAVGGFSGKDQIASSKITNLNSNILSGFLDLDRLVQDNKINNKNLDLNFEEMNFATDRQKGTFNLHFKDNKANGLKQLFESINEIYLSKNKETI